MENDDIARYLASLEREDCYRVDATLKESPHELTQRVYFSGANGSEQGPYIRKLINRESGLGSAYERIYDAQRCGRRFKHIPAIVECYQREDFLVVVMELVEGETLQEQVYRLNPSVELAADAFPKLCDAVSELHESFDPPLIHRDLKPSNVMLPEGGLVIIDFGIAREFKQGADADTARFGTRAFAPPEQFGFGQTTVRSDVYALGMLLYYCLTEKIPTPQVRDEGFAQRDVPKALQPVLVHATNLDPAARYADARELKVAFLEAMAHLDGKHPPRKRRRVASVAGAAVLALALATGAVALYATAGQPPGSVEDGAGSSQPAGEAANAASTATASKTPASQGAEDAVLDGMRTGAPLRNGFDPATNLTVTTAGVTFQIPSYFGAQVTHGEGDLTYYYAESGSSLAMIMAQSSQLELDEDGRNLDMQSAKDSFLAGLVSSDADLFKEITSSTDCELAGLPARIVTLRGTVQGIPAMTKAVYFIDTKARTVGSLMLGQTDNVQFDCSTDFAKVIASASPAS